MFSEFDFSVLDSPAFKEDSVREEIVAPIIRRLGYRPSGSFRVERSKALVHPFVMIGSKRRRQHFTSGNPWHQPTIGRSTAARGNVFPGVIDENLIWMIVEAL